MTDAKPADVIELMEFLRWCADYTADPSGLCRTKLIQAAKVLRGQWERIEALELALSRIAEGDEPRPVSTSWFPDGRASKHDKCAHDVWMYEDCGNCVSDFARAALKEQKP